MGNLRYYDIVIVGGGPAGLSAAIYATRAKRSTLVLERAWTGGLIFTTHLMENYPGIASISGPGFSEELEKQALGCGAQIQNGAVVALDLAANPKLLTLGDGEVMQAGAVILAMGGQPRLLGVPGEQEFTGKGVSYCATCDGRFFRDKDVAVVGSGDTALDEALFLTRYAKEIIILQQRPRMGGTPILRERALAEPKIRFQGSRRVVEIKGKTQVEELIVTNSETGEREELAVAGVFIYEGYQPNSSILHGQVELDSQGRITADPQTMATSLPGVYAAGDIRTKVLRQVVTAVADGAIAAVMADGWLDKIL